MPRPPGVTLTDAEATALRLRIEALLNVSRCGHPALHGPASPGAVRWGDGQWSPSEAEALLNLLATGTSLEFSLEYVKERLKGNGRKPWEARRLKVFDEGTARLVKEAYERAALEPPAEL